MSTMGSPVVIWESLIGHDRAVTTNCDSKFNIVIGVDSTEDDPVGVNSGNLQL